MLLSRRSLITGLASFLAAPAIVRASSLMPVKAFENPWLPPDYIVRMTAGELAALQKRCAVLGETLVFPPLGIDWHRQERAWREEYAAITAKLNAHRAYMLAQS